MFAIYCYGGDRADDFLEDVETFHVLVHEDPDFVAERAREYNDMYERFGYLGRFAVVPAPMHRDWTGPAGQTL